MKRSAHCIIYCLALLGAGCGVHRQLLNSSPVEPNPLSFLSVSCEIASDAMFNGPGAKAVWLRITNPSDRRLDGVAITLNGSYTASLQDLRMHLGFCKGSPSLGRPSILPRDDLVFTFSHDITNHQIMTNRTGETMPITMAPTSATIRAVQGVGTWELK